MSQPTPPTGEFRRHDRHSGLTAPWEPIYIRDTEAGVTLAIRAANAHANSRGFVHGGLISALADNAMGLSCGQRIKAAGLVTISMTVEFVGTAQVGQWIEFQAENTRTGRSLGFARASITADGRVCAQASSVFKVLDGYPSAG